MHHRATASEALAAAAPVIDLLERQGAELIAIAIDIDIDQDRSIRRGEPRWMVEVHISSCDVPLTLIEQAQAEPRETDSNYCQWGACVGSTRIFWLLEEGEAPGVASTDGDQAQRAAV